MFSPIAIGAVGGSGTRVIAQILSQAGVYLGQDLNGANDNLWFTFFLKRPEWMAHFPDATQITRALSLFARASTTGLHGTLTPPDTQLIRQIQRELARSPREMGVAPERAEYIMNSTRAPLSRGGLWGWKEPNTHIFLPQMAQAFPRMKYIHVIRNGFDMAFSGNTQQARNWSGKITGTPLPDGPISPDELLTYWIAANQQALMHGRALLGDRFHVVNYEDLCDAPKDTLGQLFDFLGLPCPLPHMVAAIKPSSQGRHKQRDLQIFSDHQRYAANALMASLHTASDATPRQHHMR